MKKYNTIVIILIVSLFVTACSPAINGPIETNQPGDEQTIDPTPTPTSAPASPTPTPDEEKETHQVVLYFSDHDLMNTYRVYKEVVVGNDEHVAKAALEAWIEGPEYEALTYIIHPEAKIEYIEEVDGIAHVSFSKEIQQSNVGSTGELMIAEQITMIMQQFGFEQTQILVKGEIKESLAGHLYIGVPLIANDPESYLWIDEKDSRMIVIQNEAFKIFEPAPNAEVYGTIIVTGLARVYEGTVMYEFEDGHFILDEGFVTAEEGAPGWGEFMIVIKLDDVANYSGSIVLYEESAEDGSRMNELIIPVKVME